MRVEGCVYVCGETEPTVKRDRKSVTHTVGLLRANEFFTQLLSWR